jgi:hypothetical protein
MTNRVISITGVTRIRSECGTAGALASRGAALVILPKG